MEIYLVGLLAIMILATVVLKGIFCLTQCSSPTPRNVRSLLEKNKKELSASKSKLVQLEIPMEDLERTSTPVPMEEKTARTDFQSDV